jgi:hypothetical protein
LYLITVNCESDLARSRKDMLCERITRENRVTVVLRQSGVRDAKLENPAIVIYGPQESRPVFITPF